MSPCSAPRNLRAFLASDFSTVGKAYLDGRGSSLDTGPFVQKKDRIGIIWCDKYSPFPIAQAPPFSLFFFFFCFQGNETSVKIDIIMLLYKKKVTFY